MAKYVVFATQGEYSDREESPLVVVDTEKEAQDFVRKFDEVTRVHGFGGGFEARLERGTRDWQEEEKALVNYQVALGCSGFPTYAGYNGVSFYYAQVKEARELQ